MPAFLSVVDSARSQEGIAPKAEDGRTLNLDFETGTLEDWTVEGDAFDGQPIEGDAVRKRRPDMWSRHQGNFWIGTYERSLDAPQGTLTSVAFKVTHPYASFLFGAGAQPETRVEVVRESDGKVLYRTKGSEREDLRFVVVDLRKELGKQIFIRLVDGHSGGWGHLNFDAFRFLDVPSGTRIDVAARAKEEEAKREATYARQRLQNEATGRFVPIQRRSAQEELDSAKEHCLAWRSAGQAVIQKLVEKLKSEHPTGERIAQVYESEGRVVDAERLTQDYVWLKQAVEATQVMPVERVRVAYSDWMREALRGGEQRRAEAIEAEAKDFLSSVGRPVTDFKLSWRDLPSYDLSVAIAMTVGPLGGVGRHPELAMIDRWLDERICWGLGLDESAPSRESWSRLAEVRILEQRTHAEHAGLSGRAAAVMASARQQAAIAAKAAAVKDAERAQAAAAAMNQRIASFMLMFSGSGSAIETGPDGRPYIDYDRQSEMDADFDAGFAGFADSFRPRSGTSGASAAKYEANAALRALSEEYKSLETAYRALKTRYGEVTQSAELLDRNCSVKLSATGVVPRDDDRIAFRLDRDRISAMNRSDAPIADVAIYCAVTDDARSEEVVRCGGWNGTLQPGQEVRLIRNKGLDERVVFVDAFCDDFHASAKLTKLSPASHPGDTWRVEASRQVLRTWKSDVGTEIRASLVSVRTLDDGTSAVELLREDGSTVVVPLWRLSNTDRIFVQD